MVVALAHAATSTSAAVTIAARPKSTTTTTRAPSWPALVSFDPTIAWAPCNDGWECGTLTVPVDWVKGSSTDTIPLALARHRATSPDERIGVLAVNPGGPGESGVDYIPRVARRFPAEVMARFDVVTWDPRGTGASRPVDCVDDAFLDADAPAVPDTADKLAAARFNAALFARGCKERMGSYARQLGTRNSARDLEAIRVALGETALNYVGFSYGSALGMTYAQMFPTAVRTMVLDGPPNYWQSSLDYAHAQAVGFHQAMDAFFAWCDGTPSCAVGSSRSGVRASEALESLRQHVAAAPIAASYTADDVERGGQVTESTLSTAVLSSMYDRRSWPTIADALARAARDGDGGRLLQLADSYSHRHADGTWDPVIEAFSVINCVDRPEVTPRSTAAELADVFRFQAELPPWGGGWATSACAGMPKPAKNDVLGDVVVRGSPPVLVIGTTGDPATPYAGAQAVVGRIDGARLLTFDDTGHTAFGTARSDCIDAAVTAYLVDAVLPPPDAHCP